MHVARRRVYSRAPAHFLYSARCLRAVRQAATSSIHTFSSRYVALGQPRQTTLRVNALRFDFVLNRGSLQESPGKKPTILHRPLFTFATFRHDNLISPYKSYVTRTREISATSMRIVTHARAYLSRNFFSSILYFKYILIFIRVTHPDRYVHPCIA